MIFKLKKTNIYCFDLKYFKYGYFIKFKKALIMKAVQLMHIGSNFDFRKLQNIKSHPLHFR